MLRTLIRKYTPITEISILMSSFLRISLPKVLHLVALRFFENMPTFSLLYALPVSKIECIFTHTYSMAQQPFEGPWPL